MIQISLDTSFLISFADPERPHHGVALEYFRHCLANRIPMWISTIAAGEFEVGQSVTDLPLQTFRIQPYNLPHAIKAASLYNALKNEGGPDDGRKIIINDLKILAQAEDDDIGVILTEDARTLSKIAAKLNSSGKLSARVLLLSEGFTPGRLERPNQNEFVLPTLHSVS
jgi:predicted nucleic acid-binding protein